jgi:hypothetical protein
MRRRSRYGWSMLRSPFFGDFDRCRCFWKPTRLHNCLNKKFMSQDHQYFPPFLRKCVKIVTLVPVGLKN